MTEQTSQRAVFRNQQVLLEGAVDWPDGTLLEVRPAFPVRAAERLDGSVIIVGFGLAGRCVADLLTTANIPFTIIERNPVTVSTQRALGRQIVEGDVLDVETLRSAGLDHAAILALTIPDEDEVLRATSLVRRLHPDIFIIARTNYASKGMQATQVGADEVIKAEQAVAIQFYERLRRRIEATLAHSSQG